jgi:penicillin-binding protein-related factor A (putative recombinase)
MWQPKSKRKASKFSNRGKEPEDDVKEVLEKWMAGSPHREANRLVDSKAARRIIAAAKADFDFYSGFDPQSAYFGLIEVKSTEHEYRLARSKVPQYAGMRRRELCGGICFVLVHHSTLKKWRLVPINWMATNGDKGSWNLSDIPLWDAPEQAMKASYPGIF